MSKTLIDKATKAMTILADEFNEQHFCIGGGLPRDLILGKPVKDIDIIVYGGSGDRVSPMVHRILTNRLGLSLISGTNAYSKKDDTSNFAVYGPQKESKGPEIQAIVCKVLPHTFIQDTFDLGLCQAAMTVDGKMWVTPAFMADAKNKQLSLLVRDTISAYQIGYSIKEHLPRIQKKYPYEFQLLYNQESSYTKLRDDLL